MSFNKFWWAAIVLGTLASCGGTLPDARVENKEKLHVTTVAVTKSEWPETMEASGTVRARTTAIVSSHLMATVQSVLVQEGDRVAAGQSLALLDSRQLEAGLQQAQAALSEARSAQPEVIAAEAAAQAQLDLARLTLNRIQDLLTKKSVSQQESDEAASRVKVAEASVQMAQAKRTQLAQKIQQAQQAVEAANVMRGYAGIQSPFAGTVVSKHIEPGVTAMPGLPLFEIEKDSGFRLEAEVGERLAPHIRMGQVASVSLESWPAPIKGRVSEVSPRVKDSSRSLTVKIDLPSQPGLRSGMFGRAEFDIGKRLVTTIPTPAIVSNGQLSSVLVVIDGHAQSRLITLGVQRGGNSEILSGLEAGEKIIHPRPAGIIAGIIDGAGVVTQ